MALLLQGILFASAGRRGFGLQTSWGHGFMLAHIQMGDGKSCWSGPCYCYISGNLHVGMGDPLPPTLYTLDLHPPTQSHLVMSV